MPALIIPAIIGAGASLGGAAIASHAAGKAAKTQMAASDRALALEQEQHDQQQQNLAPYRGLSAVLPSLMARAGQPVTSKGWGQYAAPPSAQAGNAFGAMYQGGSPAAGGDQSPQPGQLITIQAPNGATKQVPAAERAHWESRGAKVVG